MMNYLKYLFIPAIVIGLASCNDDDTTDTTTVVLEDRGEQATKDELIIDKFLEDYTYNDLDFEGDFTLTDQDIQFYKVTDVDELNADDDASNDINSSGTPIKDSDLLESHTVTYEDSGYEYTQTIHVLNIRSGAGIDYDLEESEVDPAQIHKFSDVLITYRSKGIYSEYDSGELTEVQPYVYASFDAEDKERTSVASFTEGLKYGIQLFKGLSTYVDSDQPCEVFGYSEVDGSLAHNNDFGIGVIFTPSGLDYYETGLNYTILDEDDEETTGSATYVNFIHTFSVYNVYDEDNDLDGIPSSAEGMGLSNLDLDTSLYSISDTYPTDTDGDGVDNYLDTDDDGDGTLTFNEVIIEDQDLTVDSDCDGRTGNDDDYEYIETSAGTYYHLDASYEYEAN